MANNFKSDDSFLRKLALGAAGTNATINRLKDFGFSPIELERGSTGFKIWKKIKIKRVRVPDIICLKTGLRFESRGKTKIEISMSHSKKNPKRVWDAGLRDNDFVSIVSFEQKKDSLIDLIRVSPIHFISVKDLRVAYTSGYVSITQPKGVEEGSEVRVLWKCAIAQKESIVDAIENNQIRLLPIISGKVQTIKLSRNGGQNILQPQVKVGERVATNQIVAAVVPIFTNLQCPNSVDEKYFIDKLGSVNLSERYAAAKALRYRGYKDAQQDLRTRMNDREEDIYVQLEAAAALAAHDDPHGWEFLESKLRSSALAVPLETQLETIIVASEIPGKRSECLLIEVLGDTTRDEELRAGAAWALGQFVSPTSANALIDTFNASPQDIKVEAARALLRIAEPQVSHLVHQLKTGNPNNRDGISWVLSRIGKFNPASIVAEADNDLRRWISYIVGYGKKNFVPDEVEAICKADSEVYFAASVLWQILSSWVNNLQEY
jgi:hypothetical protein